jgi:mannose-1-phosphate guanylyltransferase
MLLSGRVINSVIADDIYWSDMGTPDDYLALHEALLSGSMPIWPELGVRLPENGLLIEDGCLVGQGFSFDGWGCIGEADLGEYVHLSRSVVWDSARVSSHTLIKDSIVLPTGAGS